MKNYLGLDGKSILNGQYKVLRANGESFDFLYLKTYKNGILNGIQRRFDQEGYLMEESVYENGNLISKKENLYSIEFKEMASVETQDANRSGNYIEHMHNETSIFTLLNGEFYGTRWIYEDRNDLVDPILLSVENFEDGYHKGYQHFFHEDGKIMLIEYYENIKNSLPEKATWFDYDENGNLVCERNYKKNKKDGKHIFYDENGNVTKEINYKNGKLSGLTTIYNSDGSKEEIEYEHGFKLK